MIRFVLRRAATALLVLLLSSVAIFAFIRAIPGDPAALMAGPDASPATVAAMRRQLGLDQPAVRQYWQWLSGVLHGDLGSSYFSHAPVASLVGRGLAASGALALLALLLAVLLGLLLGVAGAVARRGVVRVLLSGINTVSLAVPTYVTGVVLVLLFAIYLPAFPAGGYIPFLSDPADSLDSLVLPALCLALPVSAVLARYLKNSLVEVLGQDYVLAAQLRGVGPARLLLRGALPNALPAAITVLGVQAGQILGGAIVVETLFAWPGLGSSLLQAALNHDYVLIQGLLLLSVGAFVVIQAICDLIQAAVDPRMRKGLT
ncbi:ABC transporter permease [Rugosimonospora acidiphila]|uniref:ABC transporter permease n=1 Tax=Rugosimonospora acidiphila TaxID=556531 RepID=A0ABP9RIV4_9ACTN